ncbi:MAG: TlpA family protein disulfide reductase [Acidobacteriia bacterium]|nr:TlpA family protein disulfide reductase [Terriglobia bacterium]
MSKNNAVKLLVFAAIVGGTIFFAIQSRQSEPLKVGDEAPDFTLPSLHQQPISLSNFRRNVVVLNFWATWCPPCVEETPSLKRFADAMQGSGITVIGVSVDHDREALERFAAEAQLTFPIARDPDQTVAAQYGTFKFPETYIIDSNGKIAQKLIGAVDWQDPKIVAVVRGLARAGVPPSR